jgi:hypothetical protein
MQCPKCKTENPKGTEICSACGYVFEMDKAEKKIPKPRISRLAITSLVLSILGPLFFFLAPIPAVILGAIALFKIKKSNGQLRGKRLAISGIVISTIFVSIFLLWILDAPPIPDDYTIADLRSAPPEYNRSFELLLSMSDKEDYPEDAPKIGLSAEDVNTITQINEIIKKANYLGIVPALNEKADDIKLAWKNARKGRNFVNEMSAFAEIADLTVPSFDAEIKFLKNLRRLIYLYDAYVCLQTEQGDSRGAVDELIKLDLIFRKLSINARSIVMKLACIGALANDIKTANFITNNPKTNRESLETLSKHFQPLAKEHTSLRNSLISEYLMGKDAWEENPDIHKVRTPMLKLNSTRRLSRNICNNFMDIAGETNPKPQALSVWPSIYPTCYNPIGSLLVQIVAPAYEKIFEIRTRLQIHDDLFQIVINKRLSKEINLKARAYSDEYIIDIEGKKIFSPGPDGKINTEDDIKLMINPDVLGWTD